MRLVVIFSGLYLYKKYVLLIFICLVDKKVELNPFSININISVVFSLLSLMLKAFSLVIITLNNYILLEKHISFIILLRNRKTLITVQSSYFIIFVKKLTVKSFNFNKILNQSFLIMYIKSRFLV